jgi:hypothetical protein
MRPGNDFHAERAGAWALKFGKEDLLPLPEGEAAVFD